MDDDLLPLFKILFWGFIIWFLFFRNKDDKTENGRNTDTVKPAEASTFSRLKEPLVDTKKQEVIEERDSKILTKPPFVVKEAMEQFFREHRGSSSFSTDFGVEESPLTCFGYRVGKTNGRPEHQRNDILKYAIWGQIPDFFPDYYRRAWGNPGTYKRYHKIIDHLNMLADQRDGRRNYEVAVSHWRRDVNWLRDSYQSLMNKIRHYE